jgi:hypothetical protein
MLYDWLALIVSYNPPLVGTASVDIYLVLDVFAILSSLL